MLALIGLSDSKTMLLFWEVSFLPAGTKLTNNKMTILEALPNIIGMEKAISLSYDNLDEILFLITFKLAIEFF